jgi:predicted RNA-binding protein YlxR (DUF448 family)
MESQRSCLSCRKKAERTELLRFVRAPDGEICFDERAEAASRGAWLCPNKACLLRAVEKRLLFRGEKTVPLTSDMMLNRVSETLKKSIISRLGMMKRMGAVEAGKDAVLQAINHENMLAVVIAKDFSEKSAAHVKEHLEKHGKTEKIMNTSLAMDEIGCSLGRKKTGVVALLKGRISSETLRRIGILSELGQ